MAPAPRFQATPARTVFTNLLRTPLWVTLRILGMTAVFFPAFLSTFVRSWVKVRRWRAPEACRAFMRAHLAEFGRTASFDLRVKSQSGGVSNSNQIWHLSARRGGGRESADHPAEKKYFAKIFLPIGNFWAAHLSRVSPFPRVECRSERGRLELDASVRRRLAAIGVAVPRAILCDRESGVLVTEFIEGRSADQVIAHASSRGFLLPGDEQMILRCGIGLAKAHNAGISLVDTQPINCIWTGEELYFTDFEYASAGDHRAWDAAFFLCFLRLRASPELRREASEIFIRGYAAERAFPSEAVNAELARFTPYLAAFETILALRSYTPEELVGGFFTSQAPDCSEMPELAQKGAAR